jgi:hypothetical protein
MGGYHIKGDLNKNRLNISLEGFMTDQEVKAAADLVIAEAKKLKPGFSVVNDVSTFSPATPQGTEEIKRAQLFLAANGVGRVVRVVGEASISAMQMQRKSREAGYGADTVASRAEAEKALGD